MVRSVSLRQETCPQESIYRFLRREDCVLGLKRRVNLRCWVIAASIKS